MLLLRSRLRPVRASLWLDGAVSGLTLAALATALLFAPLLSAAHGDPTAVAVALAYPVGDLLLLCSVGVALAITGWRPGRAWGLIALSLPLTGVADAVYSYLESAGTYADGSILSTCGRRASSPWPSAAWQPTRRGAVRNDALAVLMPSGFAVIALGLLLYGWVADLPPLAGVLAAAGCSPRWPRGGLTFRENVVLLRHSRVEALTDGLSGLANRRRLMSDLEDALGLRDRASPGGRSCSSISTASRPTTTPSATTPATRCSPASAATSPTSVRAPARPIAWAATSSASCSTARRPRGPIARAAHALSERGEGFTVTASFGVVQIPSEARELRGRAPAGRRPHVRPQGLAPGDLAAPGARRARAGAGRARARAAPPHGRRLRARRAHRARAGPRAARSSTSSPAPRSCTTSARSPCPTTSSTSPARSTSSSGGSCASTRSSASASSPPLPPSRRSRGSCASATSAGTEPAIPTASRPRRSRSARASSPSATPTTR